MTDERNIIEIIHPSWSEPICIDPSDHDDAYDIEEDENGSIVLIRIPPASLAHAHGRLSGVETLYKHSHLIAVVSRFARGLVFVLGRVEMDTIDQCIDHGVFLVAGQSANFADHLPHGRHQDEDEVPAVEFVGHFRPSLFMPGITVTHGGGRWQ